VVEIVLGDADLHAEWISELDAMRERIKTLRTEFVNKLSAQGIDQDFSFITRQKGMFSFSGLTPEQVKSLRDDYSIYMVGSGRINVAGISSGNIDRLCKAIASVV
jgi:aspartate/tyrosine/aromatic aminotransferase